MPVLFVCKFCTVKLEPDPSSTMYTHHLCLMMTTKTRRHLAPCPPPSKNTPGPVCQACRERVYIYASSVSDDDYKNTPPPSPLPHPQKTRPAQFVKFVEKGSPGAGSSEMLLNKNASAIYEWPQKMDASSAHLCQGTASASHPSLSIRHNHSLSHDAKMSPFFCDPYPLLQWTAGVLILRFWVV